MTILLAIDVVPGAAFLDLRRTRKILDGGRVAQKRSNLGIFESGIARNQMMGRKVGIISTFFFERASRIISLSLLSLRYSCVPSSMK